MLDFSTELLPLTHREPAEFAGVLPETIKNLHYRRRTVIYFNDRDQLVVVSS